MKKKSILACAAALLLSSCGFTGGTATNGGASTTDILGGILGAITNTNTLGDILYEVIGASKLSERDIIGTWQYYQPGCAFTSENALAAAGGKVVAAQAKEKLLPTYNKLGIKGKNTYFTFNQDGTFTAKVMNRSTSTLTIGTYCSVRTVATRLALPFLPSMPMVGILIVLSRFTSAPTASTTESATVLSNQAMRCGARWVFTNAISPRLTRVH